MLAGLGAFRLIWRSWTSATFVIVMATCPPITFILVAFFRKFLLDENYVIIFAAGSGRLRCSGSDIARIFAGKASGKQAAGLMLVGGVLAAYFLYNKLLPKWSVKKPLQQIRESVSIHSRGTLDPQAAGQYVEISHRQLLHSAIPL